MTVPHSPLTGRRILITGGATGIGAAAVGVLHEAGARVVATYHRTDPPGDAAPVVWLQCDVRDAESVESTFCTAVEELGGLDVLVNAAGLWQAGVPGHISSDDIDFLLATNVKGTILTNQAAHAVIAATVDGSSISVRPKRLWAARSPPCTPPPRAPVKPGRGRRPKPGARTG